ncbi:PadR family transcriptional regulator [Candidatus Omnitrophota bacterium]
MVAIQELVLLGLLKDGPKHGYEIKKQIHDIMNRFAVWEAQSIYYPLQMMEKNGYVTKHSARSGKRPEKFIYEITDLGQARFNELLDESFTTIQRPTFNIDLSLYFLQFMKSAEALQRLNLRLRILRKIERGLEKLETTARGNYPYNHLAIIDHNIELIKAEIKFTSEFIHTFTKAVKKPSRNSKQIK